MSTSITIVALDVLFTLPKNDKMANKGPSVDAILDRFPIKDITKHSGDPKFQAILYSHNQLKANTASILANIGGGHFGLFGLIIQSKTYETLTGSPFVKHTNPGTRPSYPTGISVETAAEILWQHKVNQGEFHTMHNTYLVLTKQIVRAFDGLYIKVIKIRHVKFLGVPSLDIIQHLYKSYGTINQVDIDDNEKKMSKHYDSTLPIEVMFDKIEEGMEVAEAASFSYNKNQILQKSRIEWNGKAMGNLLWPIFKAHLSKAHSENLHIEQATSQVSGFANAAVYESNNGYHRKTTAEIQTLIEATEIDRIHVANLSAYNNNLMSTITTITTKMATIKNITGTIQSKINQLALNVPQGSVHTVTRNRAPGNHPSDKNESYCWTHGWTINN